MLAADCHFAVIYRRSPVGLPLPPDLAKVGSLNENDKLNRLLQELAWDAVTHHELSGTRLRASTSAASPVGPGRFTATTSMDRNDAYRSVFEGVFKLKNTDGDGHWGETWSEVLSFRYTDLATNQEVAV